MNMWKKTEFTRMTHVRNISVLLTNNCLKTCRLCNSPTLSFFRREYKPILSRVEKFSQQFLANNSISKIRNNCAKMIEGTLSSPNNIVINFYNKLNAQFKYENLELKKIFRKLDNRRGVTMWGCEYKIGWPEEKNFGYIGRTKEIASNNSALALLHYLKERNLINSRGNPLLCCNGLQIQSNLRTVQLSTHHYCTSAKGQINKSDEQQKAKGESKMKEDNEYLEVSQLFPTPKNMLGNVYQKVANETGKKDLTLIYEKDNDCWSCTYKVKWPEEKSFCVTAKNKRLASTKCALKVLHYLLKNNHITKKGSPSVYNEDQIKKMARENTPTLYLQEKHMAMMNKLVDINTYQIYPIISESSQRTEQDDELETLSSNKRVHYQKCLGFNRYQCREDLILPISKYKETFIEMLAENQVLIIKGEPGCGKSTRIPQYVLESWARGHDETKPCRIVVTEPRRIAAISLAERVAAERDESVGSIVGYQVRFKGNFQRKTGRILYCTNGILLQHLKSDPNLDLFTHVIIDEAHERDINTDLLLSILREAIKNNPTLKVIIMSATIDAELFQTYFQGNLLHIPGFTFPVRSHFLDEAKLNLERTVAMCNQPKPTVIHDDVVKVLMHLHKKKPEGAILCFLPGWEDIRKIRDMIPPYSDMVVLCLHSRLPNSEQIRIFSRVPPGIRKIILSTNIAETSVTVEDVVYVVDTGIHKETMLDAEKGVVCIDNCWISKSSFAQRKGRAGRVREGESYHLYPKSKLDTFSEFALPEILRVPLTKVLLDSKKIGTETNALEFFNRLPSPPSNENVELALRELVDLELIDSDEKLTPLGQVVVNFQLEPKLAKTLVNSVIFKCVTPVVDIITLFSSGNEIFKSSLENKESIRSSKAGYSKTSDHLSLMRIFEIWNDLDEAGDKFRAQKYCEDMNIIPAQLNLVKALRDLHFEYLEEGLKSHVLPICDDFSDEDELVKAVLLSGVGTFLSHKSFLNNGKRSSGLLTKLNHKASLGTETVNFRMKPSPTNFLLYLNEVRSNIRRTSMIRETSLISPLILLLFTNKKLSIIDVNKNSYSPSLKSDDQVFLKLDDTNVAFFMDRKQAYMLMQCKLSIMSCYDYYIFELTKGGECNKNVNELWNDMLLILKDLLNSCK